MTSNDNPKTLPKAKATFWVRRRVRPMARQKAGTTKAPNPKMGVKILDSQSSPRLPPLFCRARKLRMANPTKKIPEISRETCSERLNWTFGDRLVRTYRTLLFALRVFLRAMGGGS